MRPTTIFATYFAALTAAAPSAGMSRKAPTESISLTNIISIVNTTEKVERSGKLLVDYIQMVKDNEPGVLEFDLSFDHDLEKFVTYEVYKDEAALDALLNTSYLADLVATAEKEQLESVENRIHFLDRVTGFEREGLCD